MQDGREDGWLGCDALSTLLLVKSFMVVELTGVWDVIREVHRDLTIAVLILHPRSERNANFQREIQLRSCKSRSL